MNNPSESLPQSKSSDCNRSIINAAVKIKHAVMDTAFSVEMALHCAGGKRDYVTKQMIDEVKFDVRWYEDHDLQYNNKDCIVQRCVVIRTNAKFWPNVESNQVLCESICMGTKIASLFRLAGAQEEDCKGGKKITIVFLVVINPF